PALKPIRTGSEMKLATKPSRKIAATTRIPPTRSVSVARAGSFAAASPAPGPSERAAPVRVGIVVGGGTGRTPDVPRSAETRIGKNAVYRPAWTGNPATVA